MRRRAIVAAVVVGAMLAPAAAHAGPWTPDPGHGYLKLWLKWLPGWGYYDGQGDRRDYGPYHELALASYGEIGIVPGLAGWLHLPLMNTFILGNPRTEETRAHVSLGDPAAGVRWKWLQLGRLATALETGVRVPIASDEPVQSVYADEDGFPQIGELRVGSGVFDVHFAASAGYGWDRQSIAASIGWDFRTGGYDDVLFWTLEGSHRFSERIGARLRFTGWHPVRRGGAPRTESPSGIGNGTSYTAFALEGEYRIADRWSIGLGFEGGMFAIRRQTGGPVLSLFLAATP